MSWITWVTFVIVEISCVLIAISAAWSFAAASSELNPVDKYKARATAFRDLALALALSVAFIYAFGVNG